MSDLVYICIFTSVFGYTVWLSAIRGDQLVDNIDDVRANWSFENRRQGNYITRRLILVGVYRNKRSRR